MYHYHQPGGTGCVEGNRITVSLKKNQGMNHVVHFIGHAQINQQFFYPAIMAGDIPNNRIIHQLTREV
jgi:hypothetical protein